MQTYGLSNADKPKKNSIGKKNIIISPFCTASITEFLITRQPLQPSDNPAGFDPAVPAKCQGNVLST